MKKKIPTLSAQLEQNLKDVKTYKSGTLKFRTTVVAKDGVRTTWKESGPEEKVRRERITLFKGMRADLGFSQSELATALHVSTKTVQGWEIGNPIPEPLFILAELIHDLPVVRKRLLATEKLHPAGFEPATNGLFYYFFKERRFQRMLFSPILINMSFNIFPQIV